MNKKYIHTIFGLLMAVIFSVSGKVTAQNGWYPLQSGTENVLKSVFFVNTNTGYMSGNGIILKTLNGGSNWLVISTAFSGSSIYFNNPYTGYIAEGTIYKTTDGGVSWIDLNQSSIQSVCFADLNTGYAVGFNSKILKTTDAGATWELQFVSMYGNKFNSVSFRNSQTGFIAGGKMTEPYSGVIYKTINGGSSWFEVSPSTSDIDFRSITFPSTETGYAVGGYEYGSSGVIYKTTTGGESWVQQGIVNKDLNSIHFWDTQTGYTVGESGIILKTTNGSAIWNSQVSSSNKDLNSVYFLQDNLGFTVGLSGSVQKTVNGGVFGPPFAVAGKVTFPNGQPVTKGMVKALKYDAQSNTVIVVDTASIQPNGDYIMRNITIDSLDIMAYPNDEDIDAATPQFVPTYHTGTSSGTISWVASKTLYVDNNLFNIDVKVFNITGSGGNSFISGGVYVAPPQTGGLQNAIVYAMSGNEFKGFSVSRSGGPYDINNLTQGNFRVICDRIGYWQSEKNVTVGSVSPDTINFYMTGINVIGIEPVTGIVPKSFNLSQNYPNPFNPVTNINVDIPKNSIVKVAVYDMLGKEVDVLVDQQLSAGSYKIDWNASRFASGIYFYRIITSEFADIKKMVLVK
ncbi:MAG: T9SS type A sorting domain-containing protein [Ignavibacteria bacterium]|nr:T9SS type A sorting domain-containing protein [Ignavibacteria bacterium]